MTISAPLLRPTHGVKLSPSNSRRDKLSSTSTSSTEQPTSAPRHRHTLGVNQSLSSSRQVNLSPSSTEQPTSAPLHGPTQGVKLCLSNSRQVKLSSSSTEHPAGGDPIDCLSATDIDGLIANITALPAATFFEWRNGRTSLTDIASALQRKTTTGTALFVVHVRHHWVAAALGPSKTLYVYDSAISDPVRRDITNICSRLGVTPEFAHTPQQYRGSNECGLFATLNVLLLHRRGPSAIPTTLHRVSLFPLRAAVAAKDVEMFWNLGCEAYGIKLDPTKEQVRQHNPYAKAPVPTPTTQATGGGNKTTTPEQTPLEAAAAKANLCFLFVAAELAKLAMGRPAIKTIRELRNLARQLKFVRGQQDDAGEALHRLGIPLTPWVGEESELHWFNDSALCIQGTHTGGLPRTIRTATFRLGALFTGAVSPSGARNGHWTLCSDPSQSTLGIYLTSQHEVRETMRLLAEVGVERTSKPTSPIAQPTPTATAKNSTIVDVDAEVANERSAKRLALESTLRGLQQGDVIRLKWRHGRPDSKRSATWQEAEATVRRGWSSANQDVVVRWDDGTIEPLSADPHREVEVVAVTRPTAKMTKADPRLQPVKKAGAKQVAQREQQPHPPAAQKAALPHGETLATAPTRVLAPNARGRYLEGHTCPRAWFIHQDKPPHVSQLAWDSMSPATRDQHRRWIRELRSMPADLTSRSLAAAALELVRRMATARGWRWSTVAKALGNLQGALANLPLYTDQDPIDLAVYPEWRAAKKTAIRYEKEVPPNPPPPITRDQFEAARATLFGDTRAWLFLTLLWRFAARGGDIAGLNAQDVTLGDTARSGHVKITLTIRRGKGARFRGPYPSPSVLTPPEASQLQHLLAPLMPTDRLFPDASRLSNRCRGAIKTVLPAASIPSVRKGAARDLAARGIPEQEIARIMGHKNLDTLRKYLGYGENSTVETTELQERLAKL